MEGEGKEGEAGATAATGEGEAAGAREAKAEKEEGKSRCPDSYRLASSRVDFALELAKREGLCYDCKSQTPLSRPNRCTSNHRGKGMN